MYEPNLDIIPLAWYDFTQNPAKEQIGNNLISLKDAHIKSFTSSICLKGNSYLEVKAEDLADVRPGYYGTQQYSVQVHFKFVTGEDDVSERYSILSDMTECNIGGINLYLKRMEDGLHLCFTHAFERSEWNTVVSKSVIRQENGSMPPLFLMWKQPRCILMGRWTVRKKVFFRLLIMILEECFWLVQNVIMQQTA